MEKEIEDKLSEIADLLYNYRLDKEISEYKIWMEAKVPPTTLRALEEGRGYHIKTLIRLCDYYGLKIRLK